MCTREMTLGEEIINLTKRGIDVPTVERMYRKYIDLDEKGKSEGCYAIDLGPLFPTFDIGDTVRYCRADVEATLNLFRDTVHNPYSILPADIKVGDKMMVPLGKLGNFTATVQKVTNNKVLFIFDDYVAKRPMNEDGGNAGGYSQSDLKKWIDSELYNMFPAVLKQRMTGLSIPTLGEICGWADKWDRDHIEADGDEQLPLMKQRRNRVAYYKNDCEFGWLRNATKKEFSSAYFALVGPSGNANYGDASDSLGVRPEFWLVKQESRGPVPRENKVSYKTLKGWNPKNKVTKESLQEEISEKENEIKLLKQEIKNLEEKEMFAKAASEMKNLKDRFVEAGFTEDEAFHMVLELSKTALGIGGRK